jgi:dipeptidyl aminopeptidase/acylaminoacyl peptidase
MHSTLRTILRLLAITFVAVGFVHRASAVEADSLPPLIPREALFGNPVKGNPKISPDGNRLAYLAPSDEGVMNIWVRTIGADDDAMITDDEHRGIRTYYWVPDGERVIYLQDRDGDENYHAYLVRLDTKVVRDLTPFQGVPAVNLVVGDEGVLVGLSLRHPQMFDMHRVDMETGAITLDTENPGDVIYMTGDEWVVDTEGVVRAARALDFSTGDMILKIRDSRSKPWRELARWPFGSIFDGQVLGFSPDGKSLYVISSTNSDTARLVRLDAASGSELEVIASDERCDIWLEGILGDPTSGRVQAYEVEYKKPEWRVLDQAIREDFELLKSKLEGHFSVVSRDRNDTRWIVRTSSGDRPASYYYYERDGRTVQPLFATRPRLAEYTLAEAQPVVIRARDGLPLVSYLTLPPGISAKRLPMILYVHGGPTARDSWVFDPFVQMLANRGYAVLQVNFRGSVGFGKSFQKAGNRELGCGRMQQDLTDAVRWAVDEGYADPNRVGICGGSYGGYAVLAGLAFTPDLYACGVEECGPSNIKTMLESIPSFFAPLKGLFIEIFGDAENDEEYNRRVSPLFHVDKIKAPLLVGQGANDPRCMVGESERIVAAMRKRNLDVAFVVYTDEGHGLHRPENRLDFHGRVEEFLGRHLGGRFEPHERVDGSTDELR